MTEETFAAGHLFFRAGDAADRAYRLRDGQVELLAGPADAPTRAGLLNPGDVFGEMALVEERPRAVSARAVAGGRAEAVSREEFERLLDQEPGRVRAYLRCLFERLRSLAARPGEDAPGPAPAAPPPAGAPAELTATRGRPTAWAVVIHPLTRKAAETLPDGGLKVTRFPLRIGRVTEAHEAEAFDLNDLWLLDVKPYNVSRNHCEIDVLRGQPAVRDRGSHLGCVVNDEPVGGNSGPAYTHLEQGENVVVLGSRMSPYQFRVTVSPA